MFFVYDSCCFVFLIIYWLSDKDIFLICMCGDMQKNQHVCCLRQALQSLWTRVFCNAKQVLLTAPGEECASYRVLIYSLTVKYTVTMLYIKAASVFMNMLSFLAIKLKKKKEIIVLMNYYCIHTGVWWMHLTHWQGLHPYPRVNVVCFQRQHPCFSCCSDMNYFFLPAVKADTAPVGSRKMAASCPRFCILKYRLKQTARALKRSCYITGTDLRNELSIKYYQTPGSYLQSNCIFSNKT